MALRSMSTEGSGRGCTIPSSPLAPSTSHTLQSLRYAIPILLLALALRVFGIATESVWVDEAFTADAIRGSVHEIVELNARDTHPPAYYVALSLWRDSLLGEDADPTTEAVVLRSYSTAWSLLGIALLMSLARAMAGNRTALAAGLLAACNPIDIYFATEARMYSQACTLSIAGALALWHWCEAVRNEERASVWWKPAAAFAISGAALLFTHYVGVTLLIGQGMLALLVFGRARAWSSVLGLFVATLGVAAAFAPWLQYVLSFRDSLANEVGLEWMPNPHFIDYVSFIGREFFWGRAIKLHSVWWIPTAIVPVSLIAVAVRKRWGIASRQERSAAFHLLASLVLPLIVCALICASYQVIYYRPRYSIFLLPPFLIGLALACRSLGSKSLGSAAVIGCAGLMMLGTIAQHQTPQKKAWRETAQAWPAAEAPAFYVVLPAQHQRPLRHYLGDQIRHTPMSVLQRLAPLPEGAVIWVANWPDPLTESDATYRDWLKTVGPARRQVLPSFYTLTQVEPSGGEQWPQFARERFRAWYRPFDVRGKVAGFSNARAFGPIEFDADGSPARSVEGHSPLRFESISPGEELVLHVRVQVDDAVPNVRVFRGESPDRLDSDGSDVPFDPARSEYRLVAPPGDEPLWIGWQHTPEAGQSLRVHWVGVTKAATPKVALHH